MSSITSQPRQRHQPVITARPDDLVEGQDGAARFLSPRQMVKKLTTREGWLGDGTYDWSFLCMPQFPWSLRRGETKVSKAAPFYSLEESMPITLALICGFQHALAMLAGLIAPPIIMAGELGFDSRQQNQMVAVSLIAAGILSCIQMSRFPIPFTKRKYWVGTGLITVVGTSFSTLSTASAIFNTLYKDGTCPMVIIDGTSTRGPCPKAYGYLLGTSALCSLLEMGISFLSPRTLRRLFPPVVTGTVVVLIGASLVGSSGFADWGGGSGSCMSRPETGLYALCPNINAPHALQWGDVRYIGLGFLSWVTIIIVEFFGSPSMKSASIVLGLIVGCIVAGPLNYIDGSSITDAPAITFLWVERFPLKVHGPSILPMLAVYLAVAMEATGDVTASSEASRQPVVGQLFDSRVQGGIFADGFNSMLSALFMNPPVSIFAQNNGVISITRCANRTAGYFCAGILILFGVLAKISGVFLAIPAPVLGGVTTFLFTTVTVSGLKVLSMCSFSRRDRVILAAGLSFGLGNLLVSDWSSYIFTYAGSNAALEGFLNALIIILSTPFLIAGIVCSLLNLTLPADPDSLVEEAAEEDEILENHASSDRKEGEVDADVKMA